MRISFRSFLPCSLPRPPPSFFCAIHSAEIMNSNYENVLMSREEMINMKADHKIDLDWVAHICNHSIWEVEAGWSRELEASFGCTASSRTTWDTYYLEKHFFLRRLSRVECKQDVRKPCLKVRVISQSVDCLRGMQEALYSNPTLHELGMVVHICNSNTQEMEAGDEKFKVFLG